AATGAADGGGAAPAGGEPKRRRRRRPPAPPSRVTLLVCAREPGARGLEDALRRTAADQHVEVAIAGKVVHDGGRAAVGLGRLVHALHPLGAEARAREGEDGQRAARARRGLGAEGRARPPAIVAGEQGGEETHVGNAVARVREAAVAAEALRRVEDGREGGAGGGGSGHRRRAARIGDHGGQELLPLREREADTADVDRRAPAGGG